MAESAAAVALKRTPLFDIHRALGAKIVPFAGYEMPVQYPTGITAEHKAVRERCGLFDVSHMGEFIVTGPQAIDFVQYVTSNDVAKLAVGQVHYSTILNDRGTIEDDCLVYRYADHLMMVVNASNIEKDYAHISRHLSKFDAQLENRSDEIALLAVQGPQAAEILRNFTAADLSKIGYYHFTEGLVAGSPAIISRTGYTGEDGFELYVENRYAVPIWEALVATGRVTPAGLGARDTLRLEMGMALYGNDIDDTTTPLEANLGWLVKLAKGDFVGRDALVRQKESGVPRKLVGFIPDDRRSIARHGYGVLFDGTPSGEVRSGTMSPSLGFPIGTCYLPAAAAREGAALEIDVRGKRVPVTVVKMPFYKQGSHL
jgi:glycine cleavage system T protein (aminomethyltransferase)